MTTSKKKKFSSVAEIEDLGSYDDLSEVFELPGWQLTRFEQIKPKNKTITLRISEELLSEVKLKAEKLGIDYQKFIRVILEGAVRS